VEVLRRLDELEHPNTMFGVGTVQEEVGLRGAQTSAQYIEPDVGFALEVAIAGDTPGLEPEEARSELGGGPVILIYDRSMVGHCKLRDLVVDTAEEADIPYQFDSMARGGTDAGRIHMTGRGAPSLVIGVPTRYIHAHTGILDRRDFEATVELMVRVVQRLDAETVTELQAWV
jgi:putative aminopeptidase FrvX